MSIDKHFTIHNLLSSVNDTTNYLIFYRFKFGCHTIIIIFKMAQKTF